MKRMKSKKINSVLIAVTLTASVALGTLGGLAACSKVPTLENNYKINTSTSGVYYYVAPDVAYDAGTGTEADPYNIDFILTGEESPLKKGDTVLVKPGTYKQDTSIRITDLSGDYDGYITVKNASTTEKAVIDFSAMTFNSLNRGVQIDGDYWYWYGVDICGAGDNGMYIGGSYNVVENCEFYNNRDTGLQLGRSYSEYTNIADWPSYNLIKNCTSYNNYDNETYGENADGFAAKLTVGYGNIFDGCIAYRNSDDGWDLYAKTDSGNIGAVIIYNCVAFENGFLYETQQEFNSRLPNYNHKFDEPVTNSYLTRDGDGNGFKLGGSVMEGDVYLYNCQSFNNRMHGVTDNSNPGVLSIKNVTAYNNSVGVDDDPSSPTFGEITLTGKGVDAENKCGNINLARQEYSYNILSNIVSVNQDITSVASDEYRGSVEYSYLDMVNGRANKFEECLDGSNRAESYAQRGKNVTAVSADIFRKVPSTWGNKDNPVYNYNLSGKKNTSVHKDYRNADGSINMGEMLQIKDYSTLFGDSHKIGADLTKTNWDGYEHYGYYNASNASSKEDAAVKSAVATLDLNTNKNATFQDFDLILGMENVSISWESSDESIVGINTDVPTSASGTKDARAIVYKSDKDREVTLTATVEHAVKDIKMQKQFKITVKADIPTIGTAIFDGIEDGRIIIDQYDAVKEPKMSITNAADYNGKILDENLYRVESSYTYAKDKASYPSPVEHFTSGMAGVYGITKKVTLGDQSKTYNYTVYVASSTADIDFVGTPSVIVNKNGYSIGGEVTSATGKLYSWSSAERNENITAEEIISKGEGHDFRDDQIRFQFPNKNSSAYYIYYVMCNLHGDVTSEVAEIPVNTVDITNVAEFKEMLLNNNSSTIYMLKNDLDLSGETAWEADITSKKKPFLGVFNGLGHTISGLTVSSSTNEQAALFYRVEGGTVENVKFKDITITGKQKVGIIATTYGGYMYNISMENIRVKGDVRVGGLIGQAMDGDLYIDQVSLVNPATYTKADGVTADNFGEEGYYVYDATTESYVKATVYQEATDYYKRDIDISGARSAGILGFIQASSALATTKTYISNCFVNASVGAITEQYVGSIVGSADDRNAKDYLEIKYCLSFATLYSRTYMGGILGSHNKGAGVLRISNCLYNGELYYTQTVSASAAALKNCSGIVGRYIGNADAEVTNCYARFEDYNSNFDVDCDSIRLGSVNQIYFWQLNIEFSEERWTFVVNPENEKRVLPPYATLNFLGDWDTGAAE